MAKSRSRFVCNECGHSTPRWLGKCPACSAWDTFVEEPVADEAAGGSRSPRATAAAAPRPITEVESDGAFRHDTGLPELDRILGGGLVSGSAVLLGGEPGVGKSTLLLQIAASLAESGLPVLYVTAEESALQVRNRAERLDALSDQLLVLAENNLDTILGAAESEDARVLIVDSIQMTYWSTLGSAPGSVGQVRECAAGLIAQAKRRQTPLFLVGHVTKEGSIAGPKVLEHMVDVVLSFEGDRFHAARILRASKNRYGAVNEIGVFEMTAAGMRVIPDPSRLFLSGRDEGAPGTAVTAPLEGSRPFLVEVQALVAPGQPGSARRKMTGVDPGRAAMLLAVLEKRTGLQFYDQDVFLNVVGGAQLPEPGSDLAIALAVAGSLRERTLPRDMVVLGEVGLGGEIRPIPQLEARLREAARLGFSRALVPKDSTTPPGGMTVQALNRLEDALDAALAI